MKAREEASFKEILSKSSGCESAYIDILDRLVRHPSVAIREPAGTVECARELEDILGEHGYKVMEYPIKGAPVVYAERQVGAKRTLLFYHHYDVQPEGDLALWESSPWKLTVRGDRAYGRGTADDKAPIATSILAMDLIEKTLGELPVNLRFVVEGEEEAGSMGLPGFAKEHADFLKADGLIWEGASGVPGSPAEVICGMKGDVYFELTTAGPPKFPRTDVHSGEAGAVPNAAWRLVWALSTLKDEQDNIKIDGFDELVRPPAEEDLNALRAYSGDIEKRFKSDYSIDRLILDRSGLDLLSALYLKPALSITGLTSGDQGSSDMTIIPSKARAKLDFRLVPDLTIDSVDKLLKAHLEKRGFTDIDVRMTNGYNAAKTSVNHPFVSIVHKLAKEVSSPAPASIVPMSGGSGPAYLFTEHAPMCMAYSYADLEGTNAHAPNENITIESIACSIAYNATLAQYVRE
jgi:acetylornithine deacetylase/succinyl-diaminopimelate desuccinylase-like protein